MKRSSFSTRRQSILNATFATKSCTLALAWPFTACRLVHYSVFICFIIVSGRLWSEEDCRKTISCPVQSGIKSTFIVVDTASRFTCFRCTKKRLTVYQMQFLEEQILSWRSMAWRGFQKKTCRKEGGR